MPGFIATPEDRWRAAIGAGLFFALVAGLTIAWSAHGSEATERAKTGERLAPDGDATRGLAYARAACVACHSVAAGELESPHPAAPSFQSLADRPDLSRIGLAALMQTSHQEMPDLMVNSQQVADLWAYMSTLRQDAL